MMMYISKFQLSRQITIYLHIHDYNEYNLEMYIMWENKLWFVWIIEI